MFIAGNQRIDEYGFALTQPGTHRRRSGLSLFQLPENPRNEEEIP
jgi:hypothetical protein